MRSRPATSRSMSGPPKRKCQSSGFLRISSHGPTPGTGASINTRRVTRPACWAANENATMLPMSCATTAAAGSFSASMTPAMSAAWFFFSKPRSARADRPMPRKSGATTVWSRARSAASGAHMSPVSP